MAERPGEGGAGLAGWGGAPLQALCSGTTELACPCLILSLRLSSPWTRALGGPCTPWGAREEEGGPERKARRHPSRGGVERAGPPGKAGGAWAR